ncbi:FAD-dependent oxidoreductase [Rhodovarius crocodyli]|uniref:Tryptophan 2-monooxygenase n=1 Tax=Rhodovarius crocodyli TaxID=1979269 RepID=A0A437MIQ4_9PROT|nr:FAD-dependent oxidoreductase [Rhodovarius crocodyli]RVT97522.1 FAD-dependent oxidoreductase [Rhodovarius crocodyli]
MNRRALLQGVAAAAGTGAALAVLGALSPAAAMPPRPALPRLDGKRALVLGAGIAGLVSALELHRAGAEVLVLEASPRLGGRSLTLRAGDVVREDGGPAQTVAFTRDSGLYFNAGPARIPHHHQGILGYCRELGVRLEVLVNENRAARIQDHALGQVKADLRGVVAELATKALGAGLLDAPVTDAERERLRAMLRNFGALDRQGRYRGTSRAGWAETPGMTEGRRREPLSLAALSDPSLWASADFAEGVNYAATMLAPVGGMDRIAAALAAALPPFAVRLTTPVTGIDPAQGIVRLADGRTEQGDIVIATLPAPILAALPGLSPERRDALAAVPQAPSAKLAIEAPRFWEWQGLYGGISWLPGKTVTQAWYPSHGFHAVRGVMVGAYIWEEEKVLRFAALPPEQRADLALGELATIHPELPDLARAPVSVAWNRMPWARAAWAEWPPGAREAALPRLTAPEGRLILAGDWLSALPGWQEGAVASAWAGLGKVGEQGLRP